MTKRVPQPKPVSAKAAAKAALRADIKARDAQAQKGEPSLGIPTRDSFQSFAFKLGVGTDSPLTKSTFGFNPITRDRTLLEWAYRGSWVAGRAIDTIADDMTRKGVDQKGAVDPSDAQKIEVANTSLNVWGGLRDAVRWSRLYGGGLGVIMIDGQDPATELKVDRIQPGSFRGILALGRWEVEPSMENLIQELGPNLGLPKFYNISAAAAGLPQMRIHYSRVIRLEGVRMPFQQRLSENMWGISILERIYDRLLSFEWATTGAAQLVAKAYLRTMKIEGLREIIGEGGKLLDALVAQMSLRQRYQGIEGIDMIDAKDEFEVHTYSFAGLKDVLDAFGQQLAGAIETPLVRLFGQEPGGLGNDGESALNTYYDGINNRQNVDLLVGVTKVYRLQAASLRIKLPDDYKVEFRPLYQLKEQEKAEVGERVTTSVLAAKESGLVSDKVALKELKQSSNVTGLWSNISDEDIEAASDEAVPAMEEVLPGAGGGAKGAVEAAVKSGEGGESGKPDPAKEAEQKEQKPSPEAKKARDNAALFKTSVGPRLVNMDYDVPLLGSSSVDGKVVYVNKGWNPTIKDGPLKGLNRLPYLVEHEAVEKREEDEGKSYATSHYDFAEPAEHARLLQDLNLEPGSLAARRAIKAYEASYDADLIEAAQIKEPKLPPDMEPKPYEHPHQVRQRELLAKVETKDSATTLRNVARLSMIHGIQANIENPKGSIRRGVAPDTGESWEAILPADYGYIRGTKGADDDQLDCFVGDDIGEDTAYVIDQKRLDTGAFDEHKTLIGFPSREAATQCYHDAYSDGRGPERIGAMSEMSMAQFKSWLANGDMTKPYSGHFKYGRAA